MQILFRVISFVAVKGTPLEGQKELTPVECLKVLAMMRFVNPTKEIRISGGREINLRSVQYLVYSRQILFCRRLLNDSWARADCGLGYD